MAQREETAKRRGEAQSKVKVWKATSEICWKGMTEGLMNYVSVSSEGKKRWQCSLCQTSGGNLVLTLVKRREQLFTCVFKIQTTGENEGVSPEA